MLRVGCADVGGLLPCTLVPLFLSKLAALVPELAIKLARCARERFVRHIDLKFWPFSPCYTSPMSTPQPLIDPDPLPLYDLERYLFDTVSVRFAQEGILSSFDFFCIVIWKANRAKSRIAQRLMARVPNLEDAVRTLTQEIAQAETSRERLRVLLEVWGFRLPMASALLTVFYPEDFTVYDVRALEALGNLKDFSELSFLKLWPRYEAYIKAVRDSGPTERSLRDKDRTLWARSFRAQLEHDLERGFDG